MGPIYARAEAIVACIGDSFEMTRLLRILETYDLFDFE
jgi:hypothetical protein